MVAPRSGIHVEQLELGITWIELIFQLDQAVIVNRAQEPLGIFFQNRDIQRLDVGASSSKLKRMLTPATHYHLTHGFVVPEECAVGELLAAPAGNQLLPHDFSAGDELRCLLKQGSELLMAVRQPRLCLCGVDKVLLDRRLDREWGLETVELI